MYSSPEMRGAGVGVTPYYGLYGEILPARGTFFRLEVYKRVGISRAEGKKRENCRLFISKGFSKYLEQTNRNEIEFSSLGLLTRVDQRMTLLP